MDFSASMQTKWSNVANLLKVDDSKMAELDMKNICRAVKAGKYMVKGQDVIMDELAASLQWIRPQL